MTTTVTLYEPTVDTLLANGWTGITLERATSSNGTFSEIAQIAYVAGQATYLYQDTTGSASDWYRTRRYAPGPSYGAYSDAWPVTAMFVPPTDGSRRSWRQIRRIFARALHSLSVVTTTADGDVDGTSLIARRLATSTVASRYRHAWVMPVNGGAAGELARVKLEDGLNLSTGELIVSPAFTSQIGADVEVEIHRLLPPVDDDGWAGLRSCANNALRELWVTDRVSVAGVTGQPSYSLSTYEEWLDPPAVLELRQQALDSTMNMLPSGSFDAVRDADMLTLQVAPPLPGAQTHGLEVFRPLDTWIKVDGTWTNSSVGFVNDTDECLANPDLVVTVALAHAYDALAAGPDGERYQEMGRRQRLKANVTKLHMLDHRQRRGGSGLYSGIGSVDPKDYSSWIG